MNWPSISDYQTAILNPSLCFQLAELRLSQTSLMSAGTPKTLSGNSACVFQLISTASPVNQWAIRCFLRPVSDQERRYQLLDQHINASRLQGLLDAKYIPQAILVNNQWYPIIKMPWVEGFTLDQFIDQSLNSPSQLLDLASRWRILISNLYSNRLAHGNLEHRNIIVTAQNSLYLVDYDTAFIPTLRGEKSLELGNENFQSPRRTLDNFDEKIDNFSALVIYLSLRALAYQPNLWQFYQGENLIFTKKDYLNPYQSSLFYQLKSSPDEIVRQLAGVLENICVSSSVIVPELETVLSNFSISTGAQQTSPNQGAATLPETRVASVNPLQNQPIIPLPSWQGTPSQINPVANANAVNPIQGQVNPNFQVPANNIVNPLVPPIQQQNIQSLGNSLPNTNLNTNPKPKSSLLLKIFAGASSAVAFFFFCLSLYQIYYYGKRISYLESDVSYYSGQLNSEREKTAKLEKELAQEKELREKILLSKNQRDIASITAGIFERVLLGTNEIKRINAKVDSLKFYEGGNEGVVRDLRKYSSTFTTASRFVYFELNLSHPSRSVRDNFVVQHIWYKDNVEWARGTLNTYLEPAWVNSYHNDGRGWPEAYKWSAGNYRVELLVDGEKVAIGNFTVTP